MHSAFTVICIELCVYCIFVGRLPFMLHETDPCQLYRRVNSSGCVQFSLWKSGIVCFFVWHKYYTCVYIPVITIIMIIWIFTVVSFVCKILCLSFWNVIITCVSYFRFEIHFTCRITLKFVFVNILKNFFLSMYVCMYV